MPAVKSRKRWSNMWNISKSARVYAWERRLIAHLNKPVTTNIIHWASHVIVSRNSGVQRARNNARRGTYRAYHIAAMRSQDISHVPRARDELLVPLRSDATSKPASVSRRDLDAKFARRIARGVSWSLLWNDLAPTNARSFPPVFLFFFRCRFAVKKRERLSEAETRDSDSISRNCIAARPEKEQGEWDRAVQPVRAMRTGIGEAIAVGSLSSKKKNRKRESKIARIWENDREREFLY